MANYSETPAENSSFLTQSEGQFLERKSCYERRAGSLTPRAAKDVAHDAAETLVAFANSDGGTLIIGVEDDGTTTGVPPRYNLKAVEQQVHSLITPPLKFQAREMPIDEQRIWIFETDWSAEVHRLSDGRYLLRVGSSNLPFDADKIQALKSSRLQRTTEMQIVSDATVGDLDATLLRELAERTSLSLSPEQLLLHYRLAEQRDSHLRLTLAALLLFGSDPARWHPRCGIRFVRWQGTERRTGTELNIQKQVRIEEPLPRLIQKTHALLQQQIPERQQLVDLLFEERFVYPAFAWQEAVVNAVAHRDYGLQGIEIEIHLFDDRIEFWSPGSLVEPVTLESLQRRERIHASRNPRIVRVLTDCGYMRELGEGIPRMFEVMEREGLRPPEFRLEGGRFVLTLYNEPLYQRETMRWLQQFKELGLSHDQLRLLAYAHEHGNRFTSRAYQKLTGTNPYRANQDIRSLVRKGVARLMQPRGRVYEVVELTQPRKIETPPEFLKVEPVLQAKGFLKNEDVRQVLKVSRAKAKQLLKHWTELGLLRPQGKGRGTRYAP
jgi:ATP-dependent DNA helicase RecG